MVLGHRPRIEDRELAGGVRVLALVARFALVVWVGRVPVGLLLLELDSGLALGLAEG